MSQITDQARAVPLSKALAPGADLDATVAMKTVTKQEAAAATGQPEPAPAEPTVPANPLREETKRAYAAAAALWDLDPDNIQVHMGMRYGGVNVEIYLHQDAGLVRLARFVEKYEGELTHDEYARPGGVPAVYSKYAIRLGGFPMTVWTLNEPVVAA